MSWPKELVDKILSRCVWEDGPLPTPCFVWKGAKDKNGYGLIRYKNRTLRVNRIIYEATNGSILGDLLALHRCDRVACCNIEHLFAGCYFDNAKDRDAKGRTIHVKGELVGTAMLNAEEVRQIKQRNQQRTCQGVSRQS